jgi:benzoyl-CoA reductase/2-hydroxyglutaryl-CoA dehydratase subunit BcrC/BadD/HgdB
MRACSTNRQLGLFVEFIAGWRIRMGKISIQPFIDACKNNNRLFEEASKGKPIIGYFCHYAPVELIYACGFIPFRISGGPGPLDRAYDLLPDFICPFLKRATERALNKEFAFLSGVVQGYTCDAACGVVKVLEKNISGNIFEVIPFPYSDNADSRQYFRSILNSVSDKIGGIGGSFSEDALRESIALYERIRKILNSLYEIRYSGRLPITARELWHVIRAGEVTLPDEYLLMLESLVENIPEASEAFDDRIPVLISGSLVEDADLFDMIESCGGRIVADDLCTGFRSIGTVRELEDDSPDSDPIDRLIDMHFNRIPCPSRVRAEERLVFLLDIINRSGSRGVIFLHQKFCSPHLSDFPFLSKKLRENRIKTIQVEMDETWKSSGQLKTRMESFFEMLRE